MNKLLGLGAVLALVAACDQRSSDDADGAVDPTDPTEDAVAENGVVATGDLDGAEFTDGGTPELTVQITLDGQQVMQEYVYDSTNADGYHLFTRQEGTNGRSFSAYAAESTDGEINGAVVSDGGQFNRFFGGVVINQASFSEPRISSDPDAGNQRYEGGYVGLVNFGDPAHGGVPGSDSSVAFTSYGVTGDVFIIADFTEGGLNGTVFNRVLDDGSSTALDEIVLVDGAIGADGSFSGGVELRDQTAVGNYSGAFGGNGATSVGGAVQLEAGYLVNTPYEDVVNGNENEYGLFILDLSTD